ncbi:CAP domain-containing protein [Litchfieldia alkalitelluris]|uniref:CAP domain-containing protein n=1 Tax=Litchfieldia alkalitelluris TaxID=304268 RepID=UPI001F2C9C75
MIKRKIIAIVTSVFLITLVGCNNANQGMDNGDTNGYGTLTNRDNNNRDGFLTNRGDERLGNLGNRDNNGGFLTNRENNRFGLLDRNEDDDQDLRNINELTDKERNNINGDNSPLTDISADKTGTPSNKYPHTKAIQIQEAKFKYIKMDKNQMKEFQNKWTKQGANKGQQAAPAPKEEQQQETPKQEQATPAPEQPAQQEQAPQQEEAKAPEQTQATEGLSEFEQRVVDLTNAERSKNGLPNLQADTKLSSVAREKSTDMQKNNYFSHTSPTYGSPFDMMRDSGVTYKTAGENIAQGQQTPEAVVEAWMNSEGHRKNILSKDFTHIGVGYQKAGHHWTQMFIGK